MKIHQANLNEIHQANSSSSTFQHKNKQKKKKKSLFTTRPLTNFDL